VLLVKFHGNPARGGSRNPGGIYQRDEAGQAAYLSELLEIFETEGVDSTFVFLFAMRGCPHRPDADPRDDPGRAGLGIVKLLEGRRGQSYPEMEWGPKAAFVACPMAARVAFISLSALSSMKSWIAPS
jgi:hypothetical protein